MKIIDIDSKNLCVMVGFESNEEFDAFFKRECSKIEKVKEEKVITKEDAKRKISPTDVKKVFDSTGLKVPEFAELSGLTVEEVRHMRRSGCNTATTVQKYLNALDTIGIDDDLMAHTAERPRNNHVSANEVKALFMKYSATQETVATLAGIHKSTYNYWLREGMPVGRFITLKQIFEEKAGNKA